MILEFLPQISLIIFIFVFLGYVAKYFYNVGYRRYAYDPNSQNSLENLLNKFTLGVLLVISGILFYVITFGINNSIIPEIVGNIPIPTETIDKIVVSIYILSLFIQFLIYISFISLFIGFLNYYGVAKGVCLKTNDINNPEICIREIFSENEDFIFYSTLEGKWGAIRKSLIQSMEEKKQDSKLIKWLKKDRKNVIYLVIIFIIYLTIVIFYRFFR